MRVNIKQDGLPMRSPLAPQINFLRKKEALDSVMAKSKLFFTFFQTTVFAHGNQAKIEIVLGTFK